MAWGQSGPFVVEVVWRSTDRHSLYVCDDKNRAQAIVERWKKDPAVAKIAAWDLSGGWNV